MNKYMISTIILLFTFVVLTSIVAAGLNVEQATENNYDTYGTGACTPGHMDCQINGDDKCEQMTCPENGQWPEHWSVVGNHDYYDCQIYKDDNGNQLGQRCTRKNGCGGNGNTACETPNGYLEPIPVPEDFNAP